ncbi:hypothetical protein Syun_001059 [Stephania yunnanensis]|uniref:Uncharacterized protein n=1 Tax=Stephania yunnanensis TaxID=152371 RepID=A0AAP0LIN8_9MAGN
MRSICEIGRMIQEYDFCPKMVMLKREREIKVGENQLLSSSVAINDGVQVKASFKALKPRAPRTRCSRRPKLEDRKISNTRIRRDDEYDFRWWPKSRSWRYKTVEAIDEALNKNGAKTNAKKTNQHSEEVDCVQAAWAGDWCRLFYMVQKSND